MTLQPIAACQWRHQFGVGALVLELFLVNLWKKEWKNFLERMKKRVIAVIARLLHQGQFLEVSALQEALIQAN